MLTLQLLYRTFSAAGCSISKIVEESVIANRDYCFNTGTGSYVKSNCNGTTADYSDDQCTALTALVPAVHSNDQCSAGGDGSFNRYICYGDPNTDVNPSSWISITAYNDASCSRGSTGWLSYACGTCTSLGNGAYYMLTCSKTGATVNYVFANYTSASCTNTSLVYQQPPNQMDASTCTSRHVGPNMVEQQDFNFPFYGYAKYDVVDYSTPPIAPYNGILKK